MKNDDKGKKNVVERIDCDTNRLYGSIDVAIKYLKEIEETYKETDISLEEHWTGYEDMSMTFTFTRLETDAELESRLQTEKWQREANERERVRGEQRKKDLAELERLKSRLGMR